MLPKSLRKIYPFRQNFLQVFPGVNMHYIDEGPGEVVLFLHGLPTWSFFFRDLIKLLQSDFRCIAIDHIGYGLSDKPKNYKYNITTHITNAIKFAEKMKFKKFHIVAHDFGVPIALALAERWPERISSMSLLNSAAFPLKRTPPLIMWFKFPGVAFVLARLFNCFCRICLHFGTLNIVDSTVARGYFWPYRSTRDRIAIAAGIDDIPWLNDHPTITTLDDICQKAFILCNKKIKFFWADDDFRYDINVLKAWDSVLPNAKHHIYKTSGHYLLEDCPDALLDIRSFINRSKSIDKDLFK